MTGDQAGATTTLTNTASGLIIGENLVPGDGPIVEYRRRRQELMDAARG
jgi:hypothetical protein